jgi:hypothetical protein
LHCFYFLFFSNQCGRGKKGDTVALLETKGEKNRKGKKGMDNIEVPNLLQMR